MGGLCARANRGADSLPMWRWWIGVVLAVSTVACGAKTGLLVPDTEAQDAYDAAPDVPPDIRPARCENIRVHTRVGFVATLRPAADQLPPSGYHWTLMSRPDMSRTELSADGSDIALLTPDRAGTYEVHVDIETDRSDGGLLGCQITVIVDPPDPACPGYSLVEPRIVTLTGTPARIALDRAFRDPTIRTSGDRVVFVTEDSDARVAVFAGVRDARAFAADDMAWLASESAVVEQALERELSATPLLIGRTGRTREGLAYRRSTFRVSPGATGEPVGLRDRALRAVMEIDPPGDAGPQPRAATYYIEVDTVVAPAPRDVIVLLSVSPAPAFDDPMLPTAIRVNDFANTSPLDTLGATPDVLCHAVVATRSVLADFLWLVDTSASMNDDQQRVGETAARFFDRLNLAGVDFRVGVMQAGHLRPVLEGTTATGPFHWIRGTDPMGAQRMAYEVTTQRFRGESADNVRPFTVGGSQEEPVSAGVVAIKEFERRRAAGETNPDFVLREGAAQIVFFVTDEPGTNDDNRFFAMMTAEWGTTPAARIASAARFYQSRSVLPFGMVRVDRNANCMTSATNFPSCVITMAGGAYIPIDLRVETDANAAFEAAMGRIVDSVAGAASEFTLPREPVSSTVRVRVESRLVPRSRADGFDYDDRTRALVFRGANFRPRPGQEVRAAYFAWQ